MGEMSDREFENMLNSYVEQERFCDGQHMIDARPVRLIFVDRMSRMPAKNVWVDRNGKHWPIKRMLGGHLCNTIRYLARDFTRRQKAEFPHDELRAREGPAGLWPIYKRLVKEARRRGLVP